MFLADLADVLGRVAAADRRADKVDALADLLRRTPIEEVESVVALAVGVHRPTHDISGWTSALTDDIPAATESSLTVDDVRRAAEAMAIAAGPPAGAGPRPAGGGPGGGGPTPHEELGGGRVMLDPTGESSITASVMSSAIAGAARVRVGDVRRAASVNGSLPLTATLAFLEGSTALASVEPRAGSPIQPMRAAPVDGFEEAVFPETCVEWAPSGLRLQAHRAGRTVSLFVHEGVTSIDVTEWLPSIADLVRGLPGDDLVLDGELDGTEMPDPSTAKDRSVWFFDMLFDGDAMLDRPLAQRRRALRSVIPDHLRLPSLETTDRAQIEDFWREARDRGRGGVVVKDLSSTYEAGRRGRSWRLVAPVSTLELVVVGAEWGAGRRSDKLSRLHLGARTPAGEFETVGRTALGVTDEMLTWQTERLKQLALTRVDKSEIVRVRPEQVVEVAFESVHASRRGDDAVFLRAARVRRYRDDLRADDAATIESVHALVQVDERDDTRPVQVDPSLRRRADDQVRVPDDGDDAPRLPPARPPGLDAAQAEAAKRIREVLAERGDGEADAAELEPLTSAPPPEGLPVSGYLRGHIASLDLDFAPYEEPVLETSRTEHVLVMLTRFLTLGWAVALTTAAFITRSESGPVDPSLIETIGWIGVPIAFALAVTGWAWSDRLTRNLKRLDGRLPSRLRCITAWLTPVLAVLFLSLTVARLDPTDVVDIRPSILVGTLAVVMWRPYSLIRRIFATFIRVRSDALLAAGYVLDLVAFGMLWWRLTVWSGSTDPTTQGDVEIMIGIGAAMSIAVASNVIVWRAIVRFGDRAENHRIASQRTRYEHRMLRLRGVDPTDPEVWWALVQRRADEQRAAELEAARDLDGDTIEEEEEAPAVVPTVDELVDSVKERHSVAFRRLGEEQSDQLVGRLREQFSTVVGDLAGLPLEPTTEAAVDLAVDQTVDQAVDRAAADSLRARFEAAGTTTEPDAPVDEPPERGPMSILKALAGETAPVDADTDAADVDEELAPDADADTADTSDTSDTSDSDDAAEEPVEVEQPEGADAAAEVDEADSAEADALAGLNPLERLAARTAAPDDSGGSRQGDLRTRLEEAASSSNDADPMSALKRRLGLDETTEDVKSPLEQLLGQAGTVQVEAALAERRQQEIEEAPTERLVPPRLYALDLTRLLLVASFAVVTAAGCWLVTETLGASGSSSDGSIGFSSADVDLARRAFISAYSVAIALIPLWTYTVLTYARRCGMDHAAPRRHLALFAFSTAACVAAFVLDGSARGSTSALLLIPGALIAGAAGYLVEPARYWFDLPSVTLTIWTVAVPGVLVVSWLGGLLQPVDDSTSLQVLAFFTVTVSLISALITVLIALSAADIEDEIRLSPELAVPLSSTSRHPS